MQHGVYSVRFVNESTYSYGKRCVNWLPVWLIDFVNDDSLTRIAITGLNSLFRHCEHGSVIGQFTSAMFAYKKSDLRKGTNMRLVREIDRRKTFSYSQHSLTFP